MTLPTTTISGGRRIASLADQFIRFAGVGAIGTGVHYVVLIALVQAGGLYPVVGSVAGSVAGALVNYALNYRFTFRSRKPHAPTLARFFLVAASGLALNAMLMALLIEGADLHYLPAQILSTALVLAWNFAAHRSWTFRP